MTFYESDLQFQFDARHWVVKKYDDHRYYQGLSSVGLKAVDFIGLLDWETVVLIEVKNYRNRPEREQERILQKIAGEAHLLETFDKKVRDTLQAIRVITRYFGHKWLYRQLAPYFSNRSIWQHFAQWDWIFWTLANRAIKRQRVVLVLWLELSDAYDGLTTQSMDNVRTYLAGQASSDMADIAPRVIVADTTHQPFADTLQATFRD